MEISVSDNAGNTDIDKWNFSIPNGKLEVNFIAPNYENIFGEAIGFSAAFSDANSDINQILTALTIDGIDVTKQATIT